jgi:hypothetical protein
MVKYLLMEENHKKRLVIAVSRNGENLLNSLFSLVRKTILVENIRLRSSPFLEATKH